MVGFSGTYRHVYPVRRDVLRRTAEQFQGWMKEQADGWNAPMIAAPKGRRDEFVEPDFRGAEPDQIVVILSAGTEGSQTRRWRELDSNFRFRSNVFCRDSGSIPWCFLLARENKKPPS